MKLFFIDFEEFTVDPMRRTQFYFEYSVRKSKWHYVDKQSNLFRRFARTIHDSYYGVTSSVQDLYEDNIIDPFHSIS